MKRISRRTAHAVYFVGIGGIGMSALARYFLSLGARAKRDERWAIEGVDAVESEMTRALRREGVRIAIGHKARNIGPHVGLVVYNRAIPKDNPEILAARRLGIPTVPYARVLGEITRGHETIAITGSHGKTTTTALAGVLLMKNKLDPTILVGSKLNELGGKNIRVGKSSRLILEADDFGAAFLEYTPHVAIVTNIDREHLDFYKTFENVKKAFLKFLSNVHEGGTMILNRDDEPLFSLRNQITSIAQKKIVNVVWYSLRERAAKKIKKSIAIAGEHNLSNALAAYHLGRLLKVSEKNIIAALSSYRGAWRRMEYRGKLRVEKSKSVSVFDDYAHHPTEIKATLAAFRERFPASPLICVFQPHQAKRLQALYKEFQEAFRDADGLILLPIYAVKGRDKRAIYDSKKLAAAIGHRYPQKKTRYLSNISELKLAIVSMEASFKKTIRTTGAPVVIMMGAGDIVESTKGLLV